MCALKHRCQDKSLDHGCLVAALGDKDALVDGCAVSIGKQIGSHHRWSLENHIPKATVLHESSPLSRIVLSPSDPEVISPKFACSDNDFKLICRMATLIACGSSSLKERLGWHILVGLCRSAVAETWGGECAQGRDSELRGHAGC